MDPNAYTQPTANGPESHQYESLSPVTLGERLSLWWAGINTVAQVAVLGALGLIVAVTAAGIALSLRGNSGIPSGWHPCGTTGAICPDNDGSGIGGNAYYSGAGDAVLTNCMSHDFGNGSISVSAYFTVTNHDTRPHTYQIQIQTWQGFGARPTMQRLTVQPGQTIRSLAAGGGSNSAFLNEPYPQPACQILQSQALN